MNREWFQEDPFLEISRLTLILGVSHITKSLRPWWFQTTPWLARLCWSSSHGLVPKMGVRSMDDSGWVCNGENYDRTWDTDGIDGFWSFFFAVAFRQALHARKLEELLLKATADCSLAAGSMPTALRKPRCWQRKWPEPLGSCPCQTGNHLPWFGLHSMMSGRTRAFGTCT